MTGSVEFKHFLTTESLFLQASLYECNILGPQIHGTCIFLFKIAVFLHVCVTVECLCSLLNTWRQGFS